MKTILIATDFSPASGNALLYGVALAKSFNAKLILFHAYALPAPIPSLSVRISEYEVMMEMKQQLADHAKLILKEKAAEIETVCEIGDPKAAIISIANEKNADLIVTGMKGAGKNLKRVLGSTATSLTAGTNVPVLIIPEQAAFKVPDVIAFASDGSTHPLQEDLDKFKDFKEAFHAKVFVVHVIKKGDAELLKFTESADAKQYSDISFEFPVNAHITEGLDAFIKNYQVKMLVMMPHKHDWAERLFRKSETKDMIFHTDIPLLILPDIPHG